MSIERQKVSDTFFGKLQNLRKENLYRKLAEFDAVDALTLKRGGKKYTSFASNDYFGLSQNKEVKKAAIAAIKKCGVGAGASRYVTGNNSLYTKLEKEISSFKNTDDAIIFSSGYACAIGVIPALVGDGDLIIADKLIHSSLIDGSKLAGAKLIRFSHNDLNHAKKILSENRFKYKKCLIITETVFSMDGDLGDVSGLMILSKEFDCILLTDDAHGLWETKKRCLTPFGDEANKIGDQAKKVSDTFLQMGTLSKAIGGVGGYVAADGLTIDYLRNFAKSQIYSTGLPPSVLAAALASLKIIKRKNLSKKTLENARYFCELMSLPKPCSAIVPIIVGDNKKVLEIADGVLRRGFVISAIRPPTVEVGKARLRITFSSEHKKSQITQLAKILRNYLDE